MGGVVWPKVEVDFSRMLKPLVSEVKIFTM